MVKSEDRKSYRHPLGEQRDSINERTAFATSIKLSQKTGTTTNLSRAASKLRKQGGKYRQDTESGYSIENKTDFYQNALQFQPYPNSASNQNLLRNKRSGHRMYQSGHSLPKTAINYLKMKKGLYMNETGPSNPAHLPLPHPSQQIMLSATDLPRNKNSFVQLNNFKIGEIYE